MGPDGGVSALDEHGAQGLVAVPGAIRATFAGALVVAGPQAGPGCQTVRVAAHAVRVRSGLAQDGAGRRVVDARKSLQQAELLGPRGQRLVDVPVEVVDAPAESVVLAQQIGEQAALGRT